MARTLEEKIRSPKLARAFGPGYRPPTVGMDSLSEGEPLVVIPDKVLLFGTGGGAYETFDLSGGSATALSAPATVTISGHMVVRTVVGGLAPASSSDMDQFGDAVGVAIGFAAAETPCAYVASGPVTEPSWSWEPGPVLLGPDGTLTQQEPTTGFVQQIGISDLPTRLIVEIQPPIALGA